MQMSEGESLRSYNEAKNQAAQVKVLAELNAVPDYRIVDILKKQGVDGRKLPHPRRPKEDKASEPKVGIDDRRACLEHLEVLITALQLYKQQNLSEFDAAVNKAELTAKRIDAAIEFVRGQI